jgi:alkylated DNA nucleotide flippase Atl1
MPARQGDYDPAEYVEAVLRTVERIPPGRVMSYGAIAEYLHERFGRGSARRVGTIMATYGSAVPWHRVVSGGGRLPRGHENEARRRLVAEGVIFRGARVPMADHAWWPSS